MGNIKKINEISFADISKISNFGISIPSSYKLVLPFEGNDGAKEITDSGNTGHIITPHGTAQLSTAQKKFGVASLLLDGNSDYCSTPDNSDFDFGSDNFTIDFWAYFNSQAGDDGVISTHQSDSLSGGWNIAVGNNATIGFYSNRHTQSNFYTFSGDSACTSEWKHYAIVRNGNSVQWYINGVASGTPADATGKSVGYEDLGLVIGRYYVSTSGWYFDGYIDEVRISNSARWTANFTPPIAEYSSDSNSKLLLHLDTDFADSGSSGHIVTQNGTAQLSTAQKKFGSASLLLDGSTAYLTTPTSADWNVVGSNSDSWTIDLWIRHSSTPVGYLLCQDEDVSNYWALFYSDGYVFRFKKGGTFYASLTTNPILDYKWHHIALVKVADEYGIYVDGVQEGYVQDSETDTFTGPLLIGQRNSGAFSNADMDEIRIEKSNAFNAAPNDALTDYFIPPTSEYSSDVNTKLLLHCNTLDISNSHHIPTFNGTAQLDTAQKKFGSASLLLASTGDYISLLDSDDWNIGSGPYTADCWLYITTLPANGKYMAIYGQYTLNDRYGFFIYNNGGTYQWSYYSKTSGSTLISRTFNCDPNLSTGTWFHWAFVRSGNNNYTFQDGILLDTYVDSDAFNNSPIALEIGRHTDSDPDNNQFKGYIDEFRLSNVARWTANFTPPTSATNKDILKINSVSN